MVIFGLAFKVCGEKFTFIYVRCACVLMSSKSFIETIDSVHMHIFGMIISCCALLVTNRVQ
jgi:hypothetical protein